MRIFSLLAFGALCAAVSCAASAAIVTTVAGGGSGGNYATQSGLYLGRSVAITPDGDIYVAAYWNVYKIDPDGIVRRVVGPPGYANELGDGKPATQAEIRDVSAIAVAANGAFYIADTGQHRIRKIGTDGIIWTVAGTGTAGASADGVATQVMLDSPAGAALAPDGSLYIADTGNHRIRRLDSQGNLTTIAGDGVAGYQGDGGPANGSRLSEPKGLVFDAQGNLYVADSGNARIRRIAVDGTIATVAGGGSIERGTDPATAKLRAPIAVALGPGGQLAWTDNSFIILLRGGTLTYLNRPYLEIPRGRGNGDGADVGTAIVNAPTGIAFDPEGNLYFTELFEGRLRKIALAGPGLPRPHPSRFREIANYPIAGKIERVAIGDVTGDGLNDVVTTTGCVESLCLDKAINYKLRVYPGLPDGRLGTPLMATYQTRADYYDPEADLALGDLNGDGIQDILIGESTGVSVFMGNRSGALTGVHYPRPRQLWGGSVTVLDVDLDGKLDVLHRSGNSGDSKIPITQLYRGLGDGTLAASVPFQIQIPAAAYGPLIARDINGDGLDDMVFNFESESIFKPGGVYVKEADGLGGFKAPRALIQHPRAFNMLEDLGDFDNDGRIDILMPRNPYNGTEEAYGISFASGKRVDLAQSYLLEHAYTADVDNDRRDDLVVEQDEYVAIYEQTDLGLAEPTLYPVHMPWDGAIGHLGGDACKDMVVLTRLNGLRVFSGENCIKRNPGDLGGDAKTDLIWRDASRQYLAIWKMDGAQHVSVPDRIVQPDWRVVATGDFQGDRQLDMIWTDGVRMRMWEGLGNGGFNEVEMRGYPAGWRVVASGDVNGDGNADLLWRDDGNTTLTLWSLKGAQIVGSVDYPTSTQWWVAGSGDFDGDGRLDVVWTNGSLMQLWRATTGPRFIAEMMPNYPQGWELAGTGDISGDGKADLMWRHPQVGQFTVWMMSGAKKLSGLDFTPGASWQIAQTGDFNGDGRTDVIWSNGSVMKLWQSLGDGFGEVPMQGYPVGWSVIRR